MSPAYKRTVSRREFLSGAMTLGAMALAQRLAGNITPLAQATEPTATPLPTAIPPGATSGDLDYRTYLPLVSKQEHLLAHGPSKLGLHTLRPNNAVGFVRAVHDAGA
ncbi:MAG: hypothetical protein V3S14_15535, partial [Anaerolineae bacterium]